MEIFTEKQAESFLENYGFSIVDRIFVKTKKELSKQIKKIGFPIVMKVSGKNIIHKNKVGGVKLNIGNYEQALEAFLELEKIKNFEEVLIQPQIRGEEFLLGIKKTPEFGHVISFGVGGIYTEVLNNVVFRVCPINKNEAKKMIREINVVKSLKKQSIDAIEKNLIKLFLLVEKYPSIKELDINPLIVRNATAKIVDARIVFE